jgi:D-serine deaminase-like pyridoxal phosphate-dependent protein
MLQNIENVDTPFLWVDLDRMEENIASLSAYFRDRKLNWRPHTKGIKIPEISKMALEAGASGITCAKLSEAEIMAASGINDILIANQVVGTSKIERLCKLAEKINVIVAVDDSGIALQMAKAAKQNNVSIGVLVEVNVGMDRAGVEPGLKTLDCCKRIKNLEGLNLEGLMAWEGHAAGITNSVQKKETITQSLNSLIETVKMIEQEKIQLNIISGAGSATFQISTDFNIYTEIQAGGAIFTDQAYKSWGVSTQPSLFVRSSITSRPTVKRIITDAGFKTLPGWIAEPLPLNLNELENVSMSSEHGILKLKDENTTLMVGDKIDYQVGYGDATVFLHDIICGLRNQKLEKVWKIQGRGKTA